MKHIEKLVIKFFEALLGKDAFELGIWNENSEWYTLPLRLRAGLIVHVDESDRRPRDRRRWKYRGQVKIVIRQPQELMKLDTCQWIEQVTGKRLDIGRLSPCLVKKIKSYRTNYKRINRKRKYWRTIKRGQSAQKKEYVFLTQRERIRAKNKSNSY